MQATDNKAFLESWQEPFPANQKIWNNAGDVAAVGQHRAADHAHQTVGAAAKNEADARLCHRLAELSRGRFIDEVYALGGAAIGANVADEARAGLDDDG